MKLIALSDNAHILTAKFTVAGEEYFIDWFKSRDEMQIVDSQGEELDFSRKQCDDVLVELKKQQTYGRKK